MRTARALKDRGHLVHWVFSRYDWVPALSERARGNVSGQGIPIVATLPLASNDPGIGPDKVTMLADYFRYREYDCIVVDAVCIVATFAAHRARIPWAVVGTDGRDWHVRTLDDLHHMVIPGPDDSSVVQRLARTLDDAFPEPSTRSWWSTSPFLSISFLPEACHGLADGPPVPAHAHFLGSGPEPGIEGTPRALLITAGTTFDRPLLQQVAAAHRRSIAPHVPETLILAGEPYVAAFLAAFYDGVPNVRVEEWLPYDRAYSDAALSIGHGGMAHVWYGLRAGVPLVAVPGHACQFARALAVRELGAGIVVLPFCDRRRGPFADDQDINGLCIDGGAFADGVLELFFDDARRARARAVSRTMQAGGGVAAAASLLEALARDGAPVTGCAAPACCC